MDGGIKQGEREKRGTRQRQQYTPEQPFFHQSTIDRYRSVASGFSRISIGGIYFSTDILISSIHRKKESQPNLKMTQRNSYSRLQYLVVVVYQQQYQGVLLLASQRGVEYYYSEYGGALVQYYSSRLLYLVFTNLILEYLFVILLLQTNTRKQQYVDQLEQLVGLRLVRFNDLIITFIFCSPTSYSRLEYYYYWK